MTRRSVRFVAAFALLAVSAAASAGAQATSPEHRVDSLFAEYTRGLQPGLAVAVVRDGGKVLLTQATLNVAVPSGIAP